MARYHLKNEIYHLKRENNLRRSHAITFSCLGKLGGTDGAGLRRWKSRLGQLLKSTLDHRPLTSPPLIIGLAESGIIPSGLFYQILRDMGVPAGWICSTRRPACGIRFTESHSHGPEHILPFPPHRPGELWFVEDEITTGRTLLHLSIRLCRCLRPRRVRYFAFMDTRAPRHHARFRSILKERGIDFSTHVLFRNGLSSGEADLDAVDEKDSIHFPESTEQTTKQTIEQTTGQSASRAARREVSSDWHLPWLRPALRNQPPAKRSHYEPTPSAGRITGSLLAVGEAVDLALPLVQANPDLHLRHITLSPWEIDKKHIFNRLDISGRYYLYNAHSLRPPLHLLFDPIDAPVGEEAARLLFQAGLDVRILDVAEHHG